MTSLPLPQHDKQPKYAPEHFSSHFTQSSSPHEVIAGSSNTKRTTVASGTELRILPLGDSITYGLKSTDNNGYRLQLLNNLLGRKVIYVGSVRNGDMQDNFNEGQ